MKTLNLTFALLASTMILAFGQAKKTLVIGTMINKPNAILVINPPNGDQGFLLPQLTTTQRQSILPSSPQDDGLMVFDTSDKSFYHWNSNAWVKGLGGSSAAQALNYDPATQRLSITSSAGTIDLSALKEVPTSTGNAGKFLTTDGTTLSWATLSSIGDITSIVAGAGLTGGATSGDVNLGVNTDGTTISINGTNQLQLANGAVTAPKMSNNAINSNHIIDGTVRTDDILDNTIASNDIANGAITSLTIAAGAVNTSHIATGGNNKILSTDAGGAVIWSDLSSLIDDDQDLSLVGNTLNIDNGTGVNLNNLSITGEVVGTPNALTIQPNTINSTKIVDGSVGAVDLTSGGNNKVLSTDGTGTVNWIDRSTLDAQGLSLLGNIVTINNGTGVNLDGLTVGGDVAGTLNNVLIQPGSVNSAKIQDGAITTTDLATGGNNKVLTTDGTGAVNWADRTTFTDDNQGLSLAGNALSIDDGTGVDLNSVQALGDVAGPLNNLIIQADKVNSAKILDGSVATTDLASGGNSKVLITDATGVVGWSDRSTFTDAQNLTLTAGNLLNITNGTGVDLNTISATTGEVTGPLNNLAIQTNTITSAKIVDGTIAPGDLATGGNNKVLTTDGTGVVNWADRTTFTDDQNLTFAGNTLSIENGTGVNLSAAGQVNGLLDNLAVVPGAANQVFVTNTAGTASTWTTPAGDVTGAVNASTVARIQGRTVVATAPNVGDALVWNGAAWAPGNATVAVTTQYYAIDPANFSGLEPGGNNTSILGLFEDADSRFVFAKGVARQIMAPVNLPHGATITNITVYYEYSLLLGPIVINLYRKNLAGGANDALASITTPLLGLGVVSASATAVNGVVDNSTYSYRVHVTFSNLLDATSAAGALQRIHGVRIEYTK